MQHDDDRHLLESFRAGDHEAYAVLVARHQALVTAACRRQAAPGDADDCAQAVFLLLARRPAAAARAPALPAWLLKAAWYVCRRSQRTARRRRAAEAAAAGSAAAADGAPRSEALDHLDDCLLRLPERQRAAIALHYLAGRTHDEVAAVLGVSRDNAYQLASRGLAALRTLLARRGVAVSAAALAALLAGEAQAAGAASCTAIAITLSATPSAKALALANGASHAMTIAALAPAAAVAGLLLPAGLVLALVAAEPAPPRPAPATATAADRAGSRPAAAPTTAANARTGEAAPAPVDADGWLVRQVSINVEGIEAPALLAAIAADAGGTVVLDPQAISRPTPITLFVRQMEAQHALAFVEKVTGLKRKLTHSACLIYAGEKPPEVDRFCTLNTVDDALAARLDRPMTARFATSAFAALQFLQDQAGVNTIIAAGAEPRLRERRVDVHFRNLPCRDALVWVSHLASLRLRLANGALEVDAAPAAPARPDAGKPAF